PILDHPQTRTLSLTLPRRNHPRFKSDRIPMIVTVTVTSLTVLPWSERSLVNWFVQLYEHHPEDVLQACQAHLPIRRQSILSRIVTMSVISCKVTVLSL